MKNYENDYKECVSNRFVNYSFIDKIILRSKESKLKNICHYECSKLNGIKNIKLDGRYPFKELFYFTEFFAALFSLFNLFVHIYHYNKDIKSLIDQCKIGNLYKIQHFIICSCWIASTFFHLNDIQITRYFDYFFAFLFLLFASYLSIKRLTLFSSSKKLLDFVETRFKYSLCMYYIFHVTYMIFVDFNYFYSKLACAVLLFITMITWSMQFYILRNEKYAKFIVFYEILVIAGALIEILDFPPVMYLIDSHAFWHLITAVIAPLYYEFLKGDIRHYTCKKINKKD